MVRGVEASKPATSLGGKVLLASVFFALVAVAALVLIPGAEEKKAALGFLSVLFLQALTWLKAQETHLSVNSRLDAFIAAQSAIARAQGVTEGRDDERASPRPPTS